jgi:translation initiation factor 1A|tara:strand:+ start:581 stop:1129 length:549 start_codon:yes stop_codon:yes gene_type:complete
MPKNKGGKNFKKGAKSAFSHVEKYCTRGEGEEYAIVTKALGYARFNLTMIINDIESPNYSMNGTTVLGRIVGKLRKRKDRINLNDLCLVGIRDWATDKKKVDIVWVYKDKGNIKKLIKFDELSEEQVLMGYETKRDDCGIEFEEQSAEDLAQMRKILDDIPKEEGGQTMTVEFNMELDFDDI